MSKFVLSDDQKKVLDAMLSWNTSNQREPYITVGGYAGTGKTTVIAEFRKELTKLSEATKIAFCSYTGKAARVLQQRLKQQGALRLVDSVGTIHSLMYSPITDEKTQEIIRWDKNKEIKTDLIVVDEASMVDEEIWFDLLSYGIPIVAVGDHGQLPPVRGTFNLMQSPMIKLEKIHRQNEGNPIIMVSLLARTEGVIPLGKFGEKVRKVNRYDPEAREQIGSILDSYNTETMLLCGYNKTRIDLNKYIRQQRGFETDIPKPRDRVICLRNNHSAQIYNGMLGSVESVDMRDDGNYFMQIALDGEEYPFRGDVLAEQFNAPTSLNFSKNRAITRQFDLFDFGYALTVHKAQGSQARRVILFEERFAKMSDDEWRRWLYTGVTRAEEELIIVGG
ncbi:MAG: AAA family ATPase [Candidatus Dojkabacteria bacterium]|nr:MAG: AAA family ATPase [Candidatus Dojkabacteria bacterium]